VSDGDGGAPPVRFDHDAAPGNAERHYLLGYKGRTLDVGVIDTSGDRHLARFAAIVTTFVFDQ
jgi:hypothetical protein